MPSMRFWTKSVAFGGRYSSGIMTGARLTPTAAAASAAASTSPEASLRLSFSFCLSGLSSRVFPADRSR
jgi:hypothetical protein